MERKKGGLLRLKKHEKRASENSAVEEPSKRRAMHQGFRPLANASTSQLLCSLLSLKNVPKTLPPLPPSELVQRSTAANDPELQDSTDAVEVKDKRNMWTPLPTPNMGLLTKQKPIILSLEQLCALASEPVNPTRSSTPPLSTIGGDYPSVGDHCEGGSHNVSHPISSEAVASPRTNTTEGSKNNGADVFEVEGWDGDLFDGEELDLVWRNIDLTVDDSSSDTSDGLPAVNLGGSQEPPQTIRASEDQYKQKFPDKTHSSGSHVTLLTQVTRHDNEHMTLSSQVTRHVNEQKQEDPPTFSSGPFPPKRTAGKDLSIGPNQGSRQQTILSTSSGTSCPPKTTAGKSLSTGPNQGFTYPRQQPKLPTSIASGASCPPRTNAGRGLSTGSNQGFTYPKQHLQPNSECSLKSTEATRGSHPLVVSSSVERGRQESALRPPLVTESCPMCGKAFPNGCNQLDADHHIAICLESDLLVEDINVIMLD